MSQSNREQLQQIAALIKSGKKSEASKLLVPLLKSDPNNAAAWWMMANAVSETEHKKRALKRFLQLRPGDEKGEAMLAKLEPAVTIEDDPFNDPDNPFVAAAKSSTSVPAPTSTRKSFLSNDDPFGDVADDEDDPFADPKPAAMSVSRSIPRPATTSNRPLPTTTSTASGGSNGMLIIGGAILIAVIAIGAALLVVATRNNSTAAVAQGDPNAYVEPIVYCDDEDTPFNQNDDVGANLPSRVSNRGTLNLGDSASGSFAGSNELHGYTFNGASGQWLVIEMWSPDGSIDPQIEVYDPRGEQFAFCDDSETSLDTYMEVRLPRNGAYTIVAQQFALNEGSYQISVRER